MPTPGHRDISAQEAKDVADIKALGDAFIAKCKAIDSNRELSLAITNAEQAVMWAVKGITK